MLSKSYWMLLYRYVCNSGARLEGNLDTSGTHAVSSDIARNKQGRIMESFRWIKTSEIESDCKVTH